MVNPDGELYSLRMFLMDGRGWTPQEVDQICDMASRDVNEAILDIVSNAVAEATDYATELGAEDFIEELDVVQVGGTYMISTFTGRTNFSTPPVEMLPHLLKGRPASPTTGNRSRVIPIGGTKTESVPRSSFAVAQERQRKLQEARDSLIQANTDNRSARANDMANRFRSILHRNPATKLEEKQAVRDPGEVTFRTASDTQDSSKDWVIPAKEMDMTGFLMDLNKRVQDSIEKSVLSLIDYYRQEYG